MIGLERTSRLYIPASLPSPRICCPTCTCYNVHRYFYFWQSVVASTISQGTYPNRGSRWVILRTDCHASYHFCTYLGAPTQCFCFAEGPQQSCSSLLSEWEGCPSGTPAPLCWLIERSGTAQWETLSTNQWKGWGGVGCSHRLSWSSFHWWIPHPQWAVRPGYSSHEDCWLPLRSQHFIFRVCLFFILFCRFHRQSPVSVFMKSMATCTK